VLSELASASHAESWAIGSLLFFFAVFVGIAVRVLTRGPSAYSHQAGLPLDDAPAATPAQSGEEV
jgi:hypothetical protein